MFDNTQTQTNIGNGKQVGRDDNSTTTIHQLNPIKHASNIERVLQGISSFITKTQPEKPDTDDYTIESKIDHNRLEKYKIFFDDYMDYYSVVGEKISLFEEQDLAFEIKLISHIKSKYMLHFKPNQVSDDLVEKIILDIESELKNHSSLELEDISSIHYVVFYVFSRCKIFEKPPKVKS